MESYIRPSWWTPTGVHGLLNLVQGHETNPRPATELANTEEATAAMNAVTNTQRKKIIEYQCRHNLIILPFCDHLGPRIETIETAVLYTQVQAMEDINKLDTDLGIIKSTNCPLNQKHCYFLSA